MRLEGAAYRRMWIKFYTITFGGFASALAVGTILDRKEAERMTRFRDKSALFGRKLAPGEPPSWP
ncbi:uncharacterized protein LOC122497880 [Leptopilina heterotoma]|uniref:uncharacterized protein LOC122497880 n=1 Tax=Leptopilina heterotoma TaxID=63436 RepID=UPI001CA894C5|nr:uncharacterized protein LOC122497880 [Leptopilina heterotoma]XP_043461182.1 uncharacterized protein LOC122497880 [Leptopilina heterotoma]XP_043461183.1 uncharacterized protein LOC122497880 [Leptopilina heterotoma]XP_043461185.1 uncharacterized protein LOC122497880 [Leptopilina heterotoma]